MARMIYTKMSAHRMVKEFGRFLVQQLEGHEKTAGAVGLEFIQQQSDLAGILESQEKVVCELEVIQGKFKWAEVDFYEEIKLFQNQLLHQVNYYREDPLYVQHFPEGLTGLSRMNSREQLKAVEGILEDFVGQDELIADLQTSYDKAKTLYDQVQTKEGELADLDRAEKAAKKRWTLAYKDARSELSVVFKHHKKMVDAFFKRPVRKRKKAKNVEEAPEATVPSGEIDEGGIDG